MRLFPVVRKTTATFLSVLLFLTNTLFAGSLETNIWSDRRAAAKKEIQLASLPAAIDPYRFSSAASVLPQASLRVPQVVNSRSLKKYAGLFSALSPVHGSIRGVIVPENKTERGLVIHIQDVHMNDQAQTNIGKMVRALINTRLVNVVALEGAFGPLEMERFRSFPYPDVVKTVADYFLKTNRITGPVHAGLTSPAGFPPLIGVDDREHYKKNVAAYRGAVSLVEKRKRDLRRAQSILINKKNSIFNPALAELDRNIEQYRAGRMNMGDYTAVLAPYADHPSRAFVDFRKAVQLETSLDFSQVEKERKLLLQRLVPRLDARRTSALMANGVAYRAGQLGYADFYRFLEDLCRQAKVDLKLFPAMRRYVEYVLISDGIQAEALFEEVTRLESTAYAAAVKTDEERSLVKEIRQLYLAGKLVEFALTKDEWNRYKQAGRQPDLASFEAFYDEAEARDRGMADNVTAKNPNGVAVLVTGGFHSAGVDAILADHGFVVVKIAPAIGRIETEAGSSYLGVFSQQKTPLEKLFKGEKLYLAKPVFPEHLANGGFALYARAVVLLRRIPFTPDKLFSLLSAGQGQVIEEGISGRSAHVSYQPKGEKRAVGVQIQTRELILSDGRSETVIENAAETEDDGHAFGNAGYWAGWRGALLGAVVNGAVIGTPLAMSFLTILIYLRFALSTGLMAAGLAALLVAIAGGLLSRAGFGALNKFYGDDRIAYRFNRASMEGRTVKFSAGDDTWNVWLNDRFLTGSGFWLRFGESMVLAHERFQSHGWGLAGMVFLPAILVASAWISQIPPAPETNAEVTALTSALMSVITSAEGQTAAQIGLTPAIVKDYYQRYLDADIDGKNQILEALWTICSHMALALEEAKGPVPVNLVAAPKSPRIIASQIPNGIDFPLRLGEEKKGLEGRQVAVYPGGAPVNVARVLARLGTPAAHVGVLGGGPRGQLLGRLLARAGVDTSTWIKIQNDSAFHFFLVGRDISPKNRFEYRFIQPSPSFSPEERAEYLRALEKHLQNNPRPILYLASRPPAGDAELFREIFKLARQYKAYVVYDPKPDVLRDPVLREILGKGSIGLFKPNLQELALVLDMKEDELKTPAGVPDKDKIIALVRAKLIGTGFAKTVLVSMEQHGAMLIEKNRTALAETEDKVIGVDSIGAGDSGIAALLDQIVRLDLDPGNLNDDDFSGILNVFVAASDATAQKFGDLATAEDIVATLPLVKSSLKKAPPARTSTLLNESQHMKVESEGFQERLEASGGALFRRAGQLEARWYSLNFDWRRFLSDKLISFASTYPDTQKNIFYFTISLGDAQLLSYAGGPAAWWSVWKHNGEEYKKVIQNMADLAKAENRWLVRVPTRGVIFLARFPFLTRIFAAVILWMVKNIMARRFFIGQELPQAERTIQILKNQGLELTVDNVGELSLCAADTDRYVAGYLQLVENQVPAISIKLSNLTADFNSTAWEHTRAPVMREMKTIIAAAAKIGAEVTIDMEDFVYKDFTIQILLDLLEETKYPNLGIAIQAYLRETPKDLERIVKFVSEGKSRGIPRPLIRLVKGANMVPDGIGEAAEGRTAPQFSYKAETDINYERCAEYMLINRDAIRPAFGTHNVRSMAVVLQLARELNIRDDEFELQFLYGMVRDEVVQAVHEIKLGGDGVRVRFYGPFGPFIRGLGYFVRRLVEKTDANSFLLVQGYSEQAQSAALRNPREIVREILAGGGKTTVVPEAARRNPILPEVHRGLDAARRVADYLSKNDADGQVLAEIFYRYEKEVRELAGWASKSLLDLPGRTNELIVEPRGAVLFVNADPKASLNQILERVAAPLAAGNKVVAYLAAPEMVSVLSDMFISAGVPTNQVEFRLLNEEDVMSRMKRGDIDSLSFQGSRETADYYHGAFFDQLNRFLPGESNGFHVDGTPDRNFVFDVTPDYAKEFLRTRVFSELTNRAGFATRGRDAKGLLDFKNAAKPKLFQAAVQKELARQVKFTGQRAWNETIPLVINGKLVVKHTHRKTATSAADPSYEMGYISMAEGGDIDKAVKAARGAQPGWDEIGAKARAAIFLRFADLAERDILKLAALEMYESGKNAEEAIADIIEAIDFARFYALDAVRAEKEEADRTRRGGRWEGWKTKPNGVSAVISPWNFPFAIPVGQVLSSLAAGNTVVFKPSEKSPHMGWEMFKLLREAGLPAGVLNFVPGAGSEAGEALVDHKDVDEVMLTGSARVGLDIKEKTAKEDRLDGRPHKHIIAELGGNNAIIVDEGADIDVAVKIVLASAFGYSAQKCSACNRVIVLDSVYEKFLKRLKEASDALPGIMGDPRALGTFFGPLIDQAARDAMKQFVARMKAKGAEVLAEYTTANDLVNFTIFKNVRPDSELAQKEQFFPTLSVMRAGNFREAVMILNDTPYALTGGLLSQNSDHIEFFRERARVGNATVNGKITGAVVGQQAFGGSGLSGFSAFHSKAGGMGHAWWAHRRWVRIQPEEQLSDPSLANKTIAGEGHALGNIAPWVRGVFSLMYSFGLGAVVNGFVAFLVAVPLAFTANNWVVIFSVTIPVLILGGIASLLGLMGLSFLYGDKMIAFRLAAKTEKNAYIEIEERRLGKGGMIIRSSSKGPVFIWVNEAFGRDTRFFARWADAMVLAHESSNRHWKGLLKMTFLPAVLIQFLAGIPIALNLISIYKDKNAKPVFFPATSHLGQTLNSIEEYESAGEVVIDGRSLTVGLVNAGARKATWARLSLDPLVRQRMDAAVQLLADMIARGETVYGATTGFGGSADVQTKRVELLQRELVHFVGAGFGPYLDDVVVRAAMLIRANSNIKGYSGLRWKVLETLIALYNKGIIPLVPQQGSITASGDLMPLAHIAYVLIGSENGRARYQGREISAKEALRIAGEEPIVLGPKEGLAFINGTSMANALAAVNIWDANLLALMGQTATALSVEALLGTNQSYDPLLQEVKGHPGQKEVAANLLQLLMGSRLARDELDGREKVEPGHMAQDRYSLRTAPQWLGPQIETLLEAWRKIETEMNAVSDNPLVDVDGKRILHGGGFQGTSVAVAMEHTRLALMQIGDIVYAQFTKLVNVAYNNGLTPNLAGSDGIELDFGFKGMDILMAGYMEELKAVAHAVTPHMVSAELNNQDVNSMGLISARQTERAVVLLRKIIASHLLAVVQAIDLRHIERVYRTTVEAVLTDILLNDGSDLFGEDGANKKAGLARRLSEKVVRSQLPFRYIHPASGKKYGPLLDALDTEIIDHFSKESAAQLEFNDVAEFRRRLREKLTEALDEKLPKVKREALKKGSSGLLGNTRALYDFVREELEIPFVESDKHFGPDTEKIYKAIESGAILGSIEKAFTPSSAESWVNLIALAAAALGFSVYGFFIYPLGGAVLNAFLLMVLAYGSYRIHEAGHQFENYTHDRTTVIETLPGGWLWGGRGVPGASGFSGLIPSGVLVLVFSALFAFISAGSYQLLAATVFNAVLFLSLTDWRDTIRGGLYNSMIFSSNFEYTKVLRWMINWREFKVEHPGGIIKTALRAVGMILIAAVILAPPFLLPAGHGTGFLTTVFCLYWYGTVGLSLWLGLKNPEYHIPGLYKIALFPVLMGAVAHAVLNFPLHFLDAALSGQSTQAAAAAARDVDHSRPHVRVLRKYFREVFRNKSFRIPEIPFETGDLSILARFFSNEANEEGGAAVDMETRRQLERLAKLIDLVLSKQLAAAVDRYELEFEKYRLGGASVRQSRQQELDKIADEITARIEELDFLREEDSRFEKQTARADRRRLEAGLAPSSIGLVDFREEIARLSSTASDAPWERISRSPFVVRVSKIGKVSLFGGEKGTIRIEEAKNQPVRIQMAPGDNEKWMLEIWSIGKKPWLLRRFYWNDEKRAFEGASRLADLEAMSSRPEPVENLPTAEAVVSVATSKQPFYSLEEARSLAGMDKTDEGRLTFGRLVASNIVPFDSGKKQIPAAIVQIVVRRASELRQQDYRLQHLAMRRLTPDHPEQTSAAAANRERSNLWLRLTQHASNRTEYARLSRRFDQEPMMLSRLDALYLLLEKEMVARMDKLVEFNEAKREAGLPSYTTTEEFSEAASYGKTGRVIWIRQGPKKIWINQTELNAWLGTLTTDQAPFKKEETFLLSEFQRRLEEELASGPLLTPRQAMLRLGLGEDSSAVFRKHFSSDNKRSPLWVERRGRVFFIQRNLDAWVALRLSEKEYSETLNKSGNLMLDAILMRAYKQRHKAALLTPRKFLERIGLARGDERSIRETLETPEGELWIKLSGRIFFLHAGVNAWIKKIGTSADGSAAEPSENKLRLLIPILKKTLSRQYGALIRPAEALQLLGGNRKLWKAFVDYLRSAGSSSLVVVPSGVSLIRKSKLDEWLKKWTTLKKMPGKPAPALKEALETIARKELERTHGRLLNKRQAMRLLGLDESSLKSFQENFTHTGLGAERPLWIDALGYRYFVRSALLDWRKALLERTAPLEGLTAGGDLIVSHLAQAALPGGKKKFLSANLAMREIGWSRHHADRFIKLHRNTASGQTIVYEKAGLVFFSKSGVQRWKKEQAARIRKTESLLGTDGPVTLVDEKEGMKTIGWHHKQVGYFLAHFKNTRSGKSLTAEVGGRLYLIKERLLEWKAERTPVTSAESWLNLVALTAAVLGFSIHGFFLYPLSGAVLSAILMAAFAYASYRVHESGHQLENYLNGRATGIQTQPGWLWGGRGVPGSSGLSGIIPSAVLVIVSSALFAFVSAGSYQLLALIVFNVILLLSLADWRDIVQGESAGVINAVLRGAPLKLNVSNLGTEAVLVLAIDQPVAPADLERLVSQLTEKTIQKSSVPLPIVVMTNSKLRWGLVRQLRGYSNVIVDVDPALSLEAEHAFLDMGEVENTLETNEHAGKKLILATRDGLAVDWSRAQTLRSAFLVLFTGGFRLTRALMKTINQKRRSMEATAKSA